MPLEKTVQSELNGKTLQEVCASRNEQRMRHCELLLDQYGMINHALLKGCHKHPQKITSFNW